MAWIKHLRRVLVPSASLNKHSLGYCRKINLECSQTQQRLPKAFLIGTYFSDFHIMDKVVDWKAILHDIFKNIHKIIKSHQANVIV